MIRHKWIVKLRNEVASLAGECDSAAAIEGSKLTVDERQRIQTDLRKVVNYIDGKLFN